MGFIIGSNKIKNNVEEVTEALVASGYMTLKFDFTKDEILSNGRINVTDAPLDMNSKSQFPDTLSAFLQRVNPMDLPGLTEDLAMHSHENVVSCHEVFSQFRYRFDSGQTVHLELKGELRCEKGQKEFIGVLGKTLNKSNLPSQSAEIAADQNESLFVRSESVRDVMIRKIEACMDHNLKLDPQQMGKGFLLIAGIDRFSLYNQAYGAQFVDTLLYDLEKEFCELLQFYKADIIRLGGDQYALLFSQQSANEMDHISRDFLSKINNISLKTLKGAIRINFSMGGVSFLEKAMHAGDYIVMAEAALTASKASGRGRFTGFSRETLSSPLDTRKLLKSADGFLQAYEEGRFRLAFQPVIGSKDGGVSFYECLLRIIDDNEKIIPAAAFISKIEDFGLVHIADQFALHQAVEELHRCPDIDLSVNVSNASLNNPAWLRSVISLLRGKPEIATRLIVEITETTVMRDVQQSKMIINTLRDLGCKIALDDFGSGYTSFHQMKEIRPDILKIDGYFSSELHLKENQVFVDAIQMLADSFNMETVGEGAETIVDANHLIDRGVQNIQGYAYGHPSIKRLWLPKTFGDIKSSF